MSFLRSQTISIANFIQIGFQLKREKVTNKQTDFRIYNISSDFLFYFKSMNCAVHT